MKFSGWSLNFFFFWVYFLLSYEFSANLVSDPRLKSYYSCNSEHGLAWMDSLGLSYKSNSFTFFPSQNANCKKKKNLYSCALKIHHKYVFAIKRVCNAEWISMYKSDVLMYFCPNLKPIYYKMQFSQVISWLPQWLYRYNPHCLESSGPRVSQQKNVLWFHWSVGHFEYSNMVAPLEIGFGSRLIWIKPIKNYLCTKLLGMSVWVQMAPNNLFVKIFFFIKPYGMALR